MSIIVVIVISFAIASSAHVHSLDSCANVDVDNLRVVSTQARVNTHVYLSSKGLLSMQLFSAARRLAEENRDGPLTTYVFADCDSNLIGFDFSDYLVGMDCGRARLDDVMRSIDALDERMRFGVQLEHVVRHMDTWHANETCRVWGSDSARACVFWAVVVGVPYAFVRLRRRWRT